MEKTTFYKTKDFGFVFSSNLIPIHKQDNNIQTKKMQTKEMQTDRHTHS